MWCFLCALWCTCLKQSIFQCLWSRGSLLMGLCTRIRPMFPGSSGDSGADTGNLGNWAPDVSRGQIILHRQAHFNSQFRLKYSFSISKRILSRDPISWSQLDESQDHRPGSPSGAQTLSQLRQQNTSTSEECQHERDPDD